MVFVKLYGEYGKKKALSKGNLVHTHKEKKEDLILDERKKTPR